MIKKKAEHQRLNENYTGEKKWLQWGPYLSERQWATVREDYSVDGEAWDYFPFSESKSRVYRWGEDGLAGISDEKCRLCFALALWNTKDELIKERLFGLTGSEGNHGEDVKELYYYLDATPSHSYLKHLYKYPQRKFPYKKLKSKNKRRGKEEEEYELIDTGIFDKQKYFDVFTEYAKADAEDILIRIQIFNRGPQSAPLLVMPTLWFRNLWSFGLENKPELFLESEKADYSVIKARSEQFDVPYYLYFQNADQILFTENETNKALVFGEANDSLFLKDSINDAVIKDDFRLFQGQQKGTKCAPLYQLKIKAQSHIELRLRLSTSAFPENPLLQDFEHIFEQRIKEADDFYQGILVPESDLTNIQRQALAGMIWTKQYYHLDIAQWLEAKHELDLPPREKKKTRNKEWHNLKNEDIISMPDKWEYPWYAVWDLAFHCLPLAMIDIEFAKKQLLLFLKQRYLSLKGQIPAYEWSFSDVNPPVHAWACVKVFRYEQTKNGKADFKFLRQVFQKLLMNFTWWVNQKSYKDSALFGGGFLGLDNIAPINRSGKIAGKGALIQVDGSSWMALYSLNMMEMAIILAREDQDYEEYAILFLNHFYNISRALNEKTEIFDGAWDEADGFFYDTIVFPKKEALPIKVKSYVGLSTLFASWVLAAEDLAPLPTLKKHIDQLANTTPYLQSNKENGILFSLLPKDRLAKVLEALVNESSFLSEWGIRSLSKEHQEKISISIGKKTYNIGYEAGTSTSAIYGGNSNWRGPIWIPFNYILVDAIRILGDFYGNEIKVKDLSGTLSISGIAEKVANRLIALFSKNEEGNRPYNGKLELYQKDENFKDLLLFYEYFHGEDGKGLGASHQTGWTGLIATLIDEFK